MLTLSCYKRRRIIINLKHANEALLKRLLGTLEQPYDIDGHQVKVGASIGIAIYPDDAKNLDDLIAAADTAMYEAKKDQVTTYLLYKDSKAWKNAALKNA